MTQIHLFRPRRSQRIHPWLATTLVTVAVLTLAAAAVALHLYRAVEASYSCPAWVAEGRVELGGWGSPTYCVTPVGTWPIADRGPTSFTTPLWSLAVSAAVVVSATGGGALGIRRIWKGPAARRR